MYIEPDDATYLWLLRAGLTIFGPPRFKHKIVNFVVL